MSRDPKVMKFPKWKLLRMLPKAATGNPRAIAIFLLVVVEWAVSRTENDWDDSTVEGIKRVLNV